MSESAPDRRPSDQLPEGDTDRKHGERILATVDDAKERQERGQDPLLEALSRAHQAKAEADQE